MGKSNVKKFCKEKWWKGKKDLCGSGKRFLSEESDERKSATSGPLEKKIMVLQKEKRGGEKYTSREKIFPVENSDRENQTAIPGKSSKWKWWRGKKDWSG